MPLSSPLDLPRWLRENADRLRPPVNNFCLYSGTDFVVMAVGGPNARADYHVNETEVPKCPETRSGVSQNSPLRFRTGMVLPVQG